MTQKERKNVICLRRYAWDIKNSTTKFSKTQFVYSFNTEKELDKILSKLNPKHHKSRESDMEKQNDLIYFFQKQPWLCSKCSAKAVLQHICSAIVIKDPGKFLWWSSFLVKLQAYRLKYRRMSAILIHSHGN